MHRLKVLVLDSQPHQLLSLHAMLNDCGVYNVLVAESTQAACLSLMRRGRVDVLICDVHPDTADGLALLRGLVGSDRVGSVILFGSAGPERLASAVSAAWSLGFRVLGQQPKPATHAALHGMLGRYLEERCADLSQSPGMLGS